MRIFILLLFVVMFSVGGTFGAMAEDQAVAAVAVPQMSFSQQVNIVVMAKRDPRILELKIRQENAIVNLDMIVDQNQDREEAKTIAHNTIMIAKSFSLDDKPADNKEPGTGLYDYKLNMTRPDGVVLVVAEKLKESKTIRFENPVPVLQPLTRAGVNGR